MFFPVAIIRLELPECFVHPAYHRKPHASLECWFEWGMIFSDLCCHPVGLLVDLLLDIFRDLGWLRCPDSKSHAVDPRIAPEKHTVVKILRRARHATAGSCRDRHALLLEGTCIRPVHHPSRTKMIQKGHHLPRRMIHIYRACQNYHIRLIHRIHKRLELLIMRAMCQVLVKTRPASETWLVKITRQEKFRHLPADLFRKFMRNHIRIPLMVLTMYNCNFHSIASFPVISLLSTLCIPALTILHDLPHQQLGIEGLGDMFIHSCFPGLLTVLGESIGSHCILPSRSSFHPPEELSRFLCSAHYPLPEAP